MSHCYESIPPERELFEMQYAAEVASAVSSLLAAKAAEVYGPAVAQSAAEMLMHYSNPASFVKGVEEFAAEHSLSDIFGKNADMLRDSKVADSAEAYLQEQTGDIVAQRPPCVLSEDAIHRRMRVMDGKPDNPDGGLGVLVSS